MTADYTVMCEGCSAQTPDPIDCIHGRWLCPDCVFFAPCHHCKREALDE
jgi:hypothetical protein